MERALDFLKEHVEVAFATCENSRPKIRVFQIMKMDGTDLYFATSPVKEVYKQLQENPHIEILSREGQISVRSSDIAFTFMHHGPLMERSKNYQGEIPRY